MRQKSVALFGLSADPVTDRGGHGDIVKALLTRTVNDNDASSPRPVYDEVWVVPVYRHAFESKNTHVAAFPPPPPPRQRRKRKRDHRKYQTSSSGAKCARNSS